MGATPSCTGPSVRSDLSPCGESLDGHAVVFDKIVDFSSWNWQEDVFIPDFVKSNDGQIVRPEDLQTEEEFQYLEGDVVVWATPVTTFNRKESAFASLNVIHAETNVAYGDLCLFVRIGKAGETLSYPRVAQSKRTSNYESTSSEDEDMKLDEEATSSENEEAISVDSESQGSED
jgi:hypothetical protein